MRRSASLAGRGRTPRPAGRVVLRATWLSAASKPRPASTQTVSISSASGSSAWIRACRFMPALCNRTSGRKKPAPAPSPAHRTSRPRLGSPYRAPSPPSARSPSPLTARIRSGVQRAGLPARSSLRCNVLLIPTGTGEPPARGSSPAAPPAGRNPRCSGRAAGRSAARWPPAHRRLHAARTRAASTASTTMTIASPSEPRAPASRTLPDISDLHLDDHAHPRTPTTNSTAAPPSISSPTAVV